MLIHVCVLCVCSVHKVLCCTVVACCWCFVSAERSVYFKGMFGRFEMEEENDSGEKNITVSQSNISEFNHLS